MPHADTRQNTLDTSGEASRSNEFVEPDWEYELLVRSSDTESVTGKLMRDRALPQHSIGLDRLPHLQRRPSPDSLH